MTSLLCKGVAVRSSWPVGYVVGRISVFTERLLIVWYLHRFNPLLSRSPSPEGPFMLSGCTQRAWLSDAVLKEEAQTQAYMPDGILLYQRSADQIPSE